MKKSFRILLTLALVFVMVLSLTACVSDCELGKHSLVDIQEVAATCTTEGQIAHKKCIVCELLFDSTGKQIKQEDTVVAKLGHQLSETAAIAPTCANDGNVQYWECGRCDKKFEDAAGSKELTGSIVLGKLAHKNAVDVVEVAATCTTDGVKAHKKCQDCDALLLNGEVVTAADLVITKLGHTEVVDDAVPATCTTTGLTAGSHCSVCDAVIVAQTVVPATGHTEVPLNGVPATCTTTGLTAGKECSVCDAVIVAQTVIPALGHTPVEDKAVEATCTTAGLTAGSHCSVCETVITAQTVVPAKGHTPVEDKAVEATCTTDGKTAGSHCSVCETVITAQTVIPAKGHKEVTDAAVAATCTTAGKTAGSHCSVCDAVITAQQVIPATGHTEEVVVGKDATCTATGLTEGKKCLVCGETTVKQDTIAKLNHTEVIDKAVAATCTTAGKTEGKHCSVCSTTIVAQEVVPALGHDYKNTVTQPTCTEQGYTTHTCSRCDDTKIDTYVAATGHTEVIDEAVAATCTTAGKTEGKHCSVCQFVIKAQTVVPATGHSEVTVVGKPATCTESGLTDGKFCTECGTTTVAQTIIPTKAHTPVTVAGKPATCTESGLTDGSKCSVCNKVITEQQVIDAKGHTEKTLAAVAATCTEDGLTEGKQCSVCNKVLVAQETVAALGHDMDAGIVTTPATCTAAGVKTYTCQRQGCGHFTTEAIDATGHTNVTDPAVAPTCEETGLTEGSHCSVCGTVLAEQEDVDALGHDNKAVVTDPTCEQDGYTTYTCQRQGCDYSYVEVDEGSALGHNWQLKIDKQPTYTETGLSHEECSRCNAKQNENTVVEKLDHEHNYQQTVTAPTCTTDGYTTYKCTICDYTYTDNKVEKLNHNFGEWVVTTPATCENAGEQTRTCANDVSHKETQSIPATGHAETSKYVVIGEKLYSVKTCECASTRKLVPADTVVEISNDADLQTVVEFGYSVKLTADINLTSALEIVGKTLTIDLNGHTLTADWASDDVVEVLFIRNDSHVIVTGNGTMISGDKSEHTNSVISCIENSTLTIENGTFISNDCGDVIYARTNSVVTILGGHFEAATAYEDGKWYVLDILESEPAEKRGQFIVKGGEFVNFDPANHRCDGDSYTNKLADGFHSIKDGNIYTVSAHTVVTDAAVAPTCEETGLTAGSHCSVCNAVIVAQQEIKALGHSFTVYTPNNNATCLENGTKTATCDRCDATDTITDEDSALGHQLVQHEAKDATCRENEKWWDAYETCARCEHSTKVEKDPIAHTVVTDAAVSATCTTAGKTEGSHCSVCEKIIVAQQTINALNHDYKAVVTAPTCTQAGYTTYTCQRENCGDTYTGNPTAATGHTEETIPAVDPTCTASGLTAGTKCSICGITLTAQTTIDALNHNFVVDEEVPATCTTAGKTEGKHCDRCSFVSVAQQVIPATGHDHKGVVTAPTCEAEGFTTYTCHCGDTYTDDEVDALGHDEVAHEAQAPTCIATGHDAYVTCTRCSYTTYQELAVLGHNFENYISNNNETCLADGTKTATCTRCPATDTITNEDSALGHNFVNYVSNNDATCTANGTETAKCERCEVKDTREDDNSMIDHDLVHHEAVTATCEKQGNIEYWSCEVCEKLFTDEDATIETTLDEVTINALGHEYSYTNNKIGTHKVTCSRCDYTDTADHVYDQAENKCICGKDKPQGGGYVLVTDAKTLQAGDQIVIVAQGKNMAMGAYTKNSYYAGVENTVNGDTLPFNPDVTVITLGGTEGAWTLAVSATEFLGWSSSNSLITLGSNGGSNIQWKITIANNGTATILNGADNTRSLQWNAGSPRFACYTSKQTAVEIYRQEAAGCEHVGTQTREENVVPATCTENGSKDIFCDYCDEKIRTETIEATDHDYDAGVVTAPNCTEGGYTTFTCQVEGCGHSYQGNLENPNGHKDVDPVDGTCDVCGADVCAHENKTSHEKVDATCQATGTQAHDECDVCHTLFVGEEIVTAESLVIEIDPDNHNMPITWTKATNFQHSHTCQNQGCDHVETVDCTFNEGGNCTDCDRTGVIVTIEAALAADDEKEVCLIGRVSSIDIDWNNQYNNYSINIKDAAGNEIYLYRTGGEQAKVGDLIRVVGKMGTYEGNRQVVNSTGKILEVHTECTEFTEADCLNPEICTACGKVKEDSEALGHTTENGECGRCGETINAFASVEGTISFATKDQRQSYSTTQQVWTNGSVTLTNDKASSTNNVYDAAPIRLYQNSSIVVSVPDGYVITQIVFNCNSNDYATALKNSIGASATVDGSVVTVVLTGESNRFTVAKLSAQVRLDSIVVTYQKACDHADTTTTTVPATCTTAGSTTVKCDTCGKVLSTTPSAALGHSWNEGEVTTPASCTATGIKTYTCTRTDCEETKTETVEMVDHTPETVEGKDATCTETGLTDGQKCSVCDKELQPQVETPATGHVDSDSDGVCDNCPEVLEQCEHINTTTTCTATCTETGQEITTCDDCGQQVDQEFVKALGHSWNGGEQTITPTCSQLGEMTYTCTREDCGETRTEVLDMLEHDVTDVDWTNDETNHWKVCPDCEAEVNKAAHSGDTCTVCDYVKPAEKTWTLVTDASQLVAGAQVIIAAKDSNFAMSTEQKSNNRGQAAITKSGDNLNTPNSSVQIMTLQAGKSAGTWAFYTGTKGYLFAASSSSNYLRTETTLSLNSSWTISIASAGVATIKATGTNTRNVMQYNKNSSLFACYSSASQQSIVIYVLQ